MTKSVVILGKTTAPPTEKPAFVSIGKSMAERNIQLITTNTPGACAAIVEGYTESGGTPQYMEKGRMPEDYNPTEIMLFSDKKFQEKLDERLPAWREHNWLVFHNRKEIITANQWIRQVVAELDIGTVGSGTQ